MRAMATLPTPLIRTKSHAQQVLEHRLGEPLEVALHRLYAVEGHNQDAIAAAWGIDRATVSRWMRDCGIPARTTGPRSAR